LRLVAGEPFDVTEELRRLCRLPVFADGRLVRELPTLRVRRAARRPRSRLGFAVPDQWRLSVTVYPSIHREDIEETLLHELVHLHVGIEPGRRRWHGPRFKETLRQAMAEAYGVHGIDPPSACHGAYAEALTRLRVEQAARERGDQLQLPIAA
jgi:SprT-like family protein